MTKWGTFYSKTYKGWILAATRLVPQCDGPAVAEPVRAIVTLAIPRAKTSKLVVPVGDGDNYEKAIYDLIQKKGYLEDDKWITTGLWRKRFLPYGEDGYTLIELYKETEEIDIEPA